MMLEQSLINPNFLGRDGFRWFIGVASDYRDCADDSGGYRCKVRIIGYHPGEEYLKDKDLPWAQVLVPLTMGSGVRGAGCSFSQITGGSTVIGFFLDGDDGQQPIVIGSLFTGANVDITQELNKGTANFNPFKPPSSYITNKFNVSVDKPVKTEIKVGDTVGSGTSTSTPSPAGVPLSNGNSPENKQSAGAAATQNSTTVTIVSECKSGADTYSKILQALRDFVKVLNTIKNVKSAYIDPVLNKIQDIPALIQRVGLAISDAISLFIKRTRDFIINEIYTRLKRLIDQIKLPKDLEFLKKVAFGEITDGIWCAIGKILKRVFGFVTSFITQMVNSVVSLPLCALEATVGSIIQAVTNEIAAAITPIIEQALETIGGPIGEAISYVDQAINYAKGLINFLSCEPKECKEQFDYEMNKGFIPKSDVNFENILNYDPAQGVTNLLSDGQKSFENWLGISPPPEGSTIVGKVETGPGVFTVDYLTPDGQVITRTEGGDKVTGSCNVVDLRCGLPTVSIFGGGGSGATGNVVVDTVGQIIGVDITNPGSGYVSPPEVYFEDACDNGRGAQAVAVIGPVKKPAGIGSTDVGPGIGTTSGVLYVPVLEPGSGYLPPSGDDPVDDKGKKKVGIVTDVMIKDPGKDYDDEDDIEVPGTDVAIKPITDPEGRIIGVNIINPGTAITTYPRVQINTQNGQGAVLIPILTFRDKEVIPIQQPTKGQVIYCAEDHGRG